MPTPQVVSRGRLAFASLVIRHMKDLMSKRYRRSDSFIWDVYDAILYQSAGFVVHGLACLAIFAFSFVGPLSLSLSLEDCVHVNLER